MLTGVFIAIFGILIVLTARSVTTLFHELGHAIPALLFSSQPVVVHVGSYGDISHSLRLPLGRLTVYLKFNILDWQLGLCRHEGDINYLHWFIIILGGPLISLIIAGFMLYGLFQEAVPDGTKVVMGLFLLSSTWDFFINIIPSSQPMKLHDGDMIHNDGYQLQRLLKLGTHSYDFDLAMDHWKSGKVETAISNLEHLRTTMPKNRIIAQALIEVLLKEQRYEAAKTQFEQFYYDKKLKPHEFELQGDIYKGLRDWPKAVNAYNNYLYHNYVDYNVINKKVEVMLEMGAFEQAVTDARISIQIAEGKNFLGWLNYGRIQLRERNFAEAEKYLLKAVNAKDGSASAHLHLAFYYEECYEYESALKHFSRAKDLGTDYHGIDFKIDLVERALDS